MPGVSFYKRCDENDQILIWFQRFVFHHSLLSKGCTNNNSQYTGRVLKGISYAHHVGSAEIPELLFVEQNFITWYWIFDSLMLTVCYIKVSFPIHITGVSGMALKLGNGPGCVKHPDRALLSDKLRARWSWRGMGDNQPHIEQQLQCIYHRCSWE